MWRINDEWWIMSDELQLGKYEFFPYKDYWEKIFIELKELEMTDEEREKWQKEFFEKFKKLKKKKNKNKFERVFQSHKRRIEFSRVF